MVYPYPRVPYGITQHLKPGKPVSNTLWQDKNIAKLGQILGSNEEVFFQ